MDTQTDQCERRLSALLILSFLVVLAMLARPMFVGGVYTHDDLGWLQLPQRYLYWKALTGGDELLWTPQLANGLYLLGEGHVGMYHPLHLVLYRLLPFEWAFNLEFILSYALMFPGMYLMLRRLDLPPSASLFGALAFTFCGFHLLHFMHPDQVAINAHIPWLILAIDTVLRTTDRRKLAVAQLGIALLTGSQLLLGHPQQVWFSGLAEGAFVVWRVKTSVGWGRVLAVGLGKVVGVMLGAVQLIPTLDALFRSGRSNPSLEAVLRFSLHPANLVQLWSPFALAGRTLDTFTQEAVLYSGAFSTLALVWLCVRRHSLGHRRPLVVVTTACAAVSLIVALGKYGGVSQVLAAVPLVGLLRGPSRYVTLVHLALAVLVAVAFTDLVGLVRRRERVPWRALWPLAAFAALSLATTIALAWVWGQLPHQPWVARLASVEQSMIGLVLVVTATLLVVAAARGVRWSLYAIVVWTVVDLTVWGISWVWAVPPRPLAAVAEAHIEPPEPGEGRVYSRWNSANALTMQGYQLTHGYLTFVPARVLDPTGLTAQRLAGVRWVLHTDGLPVQSPFDYPQGHGSWMEVPDPMPRVRMVSHALVSDAIAEDVARIDIAHTALLDREVDLEPGEVGTARIVTDRPGFIEVTTSSPSRQLLILAESYHPGWQATEDRRPISVLRAYGDFQACVVEPGERRIVFRFRPASFIAGAWVSSLGVCFALAGFVVMRHFPRATVPRYIKDPG